MTRKALARGEYAKPTGLAWANRGCSILRATLITVRAEAIVASVLGGIVPRVATSATTPQGRVWGPDDTSSLT
jgi:hypothetical protein